MRGSSFGLGSDLGFGYGNNILGFFAGATIFLTIIYFAVILIVAVVEYYMYCVTQDKISGKVGLSDNWMAYVPIARNIQRMRIADMPMWKCMFVGSIFTLSLSLLVIVGVSALLCMINATFGAVVGFILVIVYAIMFITFKYEYLVKICDIFGFAKPMALFLLLGLPVVMPLIAFSNRIQAGGKLPVDDKSQPISNNEPAGILGISGMYANAKFNMRDNETFVIGRDGTLSNIVISTESDKVSRRHCSVRYIASENCYEVTDYSLNGTFYGNSKLIKEQPTKVQRGTVIVVGDKANQFKLL